MKKVPDCMLICREEKEHEGDDLTRAVRRLQGAVFERAWYDLDYIQHGHLIVESSLFWFKDQDRDDQLSFEEVVESMKLRRWMIEELNKRIEQAQEFMEAYKKWEVLDDPADKLGFALRKGHKISGKNRPFARYVA